jgi:hypothetical protein
MKVHVLTKTVYNTLAKAYKAYRVISEGKAEPIETIVWSDWGIEEYIVLPVDSSVEKRTDIIVDTGGKVYAFTVISLTAQEIAAKEKSRIDSDLQQATISSAILITEVFALLYADGVLNVPALSDKAKEEFATLTDLVNQYTP